MVNNPKCEHNYGGMCEKKEEDCCDTDECPDPIASARAYVKQSENRALTVVMKALEWLETRIEELESK